MTDAGVFFLRQVFTHLTLFDFHFKADKNGHVNGNHCHDQAFDKGYHCHGLILRRLFPVNVKLYLQRVRRRDGFGCRPHFKACLHGMAVNSHFPLRFFLQVIPRIFQHSKTAGRGNGLVIVVHGYDEFHLDTLKKKCVKAAVAAKCSNNGGRL